MNPVEHQIGSVRLQKIDCISSVNDWKLIIEARFAPTELLNLALALVWIIE